MSDFMDFVRRTDEEMSEERSLAVVTDKVTKLEIVRKWYRATQKELAQSAGVSEVTVGRIEAGKAARLNSLERLARAVRWQGSPESLMELVDEKEHGMTAGVEWLKDDDSVTAS